MKLPEIHSVKCVFASALVKSAGLNEEERADLFNHLAEEDFTWGTNANTLISASDFMDFLSEYECCGYCRTKPDRLANLSVLLGELDSMDVSIDLES